MGSSTDGFIVLWSYGKTTFYSNNLAKYPQLRLSFTFSSICLLLFSCSISKMILHACHTVLKLDACLVLVKLRKRSSVYFAL